MVKALRISVTTIFLMAGVVVGTVWLGALSGLLPTEQPILGNRWPPHSSDLPWEIRLDRNQMRSEFGLPLEWSPSLVDMRTYDGFGFQFQGSRRVLFVRVPYWFLIALCAAAAALPWVRCRFSLRTFLIATALVALVMGLAVASI